MPKTTSGINFTKAANSSALAPVARLLDTYFTGVNNHDAATAASVFAPNGPVDPNSVSQVARFGKGIRTTTDDQIAVLSIDRTTSSVGPGVSVRVKFRSRQAASLGPNNETCTRWAITYQMVSDGAGGFELLGINNVAHRAC